MSGAIIPTPDSGADWDDVETQIVKARRGYIGLSLTEFDTLVIPQIAAGSVIEINGVLFSFSSNESITGAASSGYINYMVATVAGSGNSQTVTFGWTITAPSWVESKHGWYGAGDGNDRYLGGCYFDGTNYTGKWVYHEARNITGLTEGIKGLLGIGGVKVGNATRNASGDQVITGVGFQPSVVIFFARAWPSSEPEFSWGFDTGSVAVCTYQCNDPVDSGDSTTYSIWIQTGGASDSLRGAISALSSDGFTITWTSAGTIPTINFMYLALP